MARVSPGASRLPLAAGRGSLSGLAKTMAKKQQNDPKDTPMMRQYWQYREQLPADTLLLFRLGDFYEMFYKDAEDGAAVLGITLTQRSGYPMAGIPFHASEAYIPKLLGAGRKVAIVDQIETPKPGKLVQRALTRVLTPGTTLEDQHLEARSNHYLLALCRRRGGFHASWIDLSTGDFLLASAEDPNEFTALFEALAPREILLPEGARANWAEDAEIAEWYESFDRMCQGKTLTELGTAYFDVEEGRGLVTRSLRLLNLDGFGIAASHLALGPAGALLRYAEETLCAPLQGLTSVREYCPAEALRVDPATLRNLEVFRSALGTRQGSLLEAIDRTKTAAGARMLEQWLACPLLDLTELHRRQEAVGELIEEPRAAARLSELLGSVRDLPRILGRLQNRLRNPRELGAVRETLAQLPAIRAVLDETGGFRLEELANRIELFEELAVHLTRALRESLPNNLNDGGVIAEGFDPELDRLRALTTDNQAWISDLETSEQQSTGIKNLKVKYNGAFGYFIEVTKANLHLVPEHYIRRQTMVNAERYVTEALRQKEKEILGAEEQAIARETELFGGIVERVLAEADALRGTAEALAETDVFCGWATLAREWNFCRPTVDDSDVLEITEGRHPVIEQKLAQESHGLGGAHAFVPNDTALSSSRDQIALITGPNMAGKSTYIRQVALIALLAQTGCWVPAKACHLGKVDRIFSRVGASDELARGNSTFMVEMNETANILNHATDRSLIILDEIGRGTSTYDGLSIAWAVIEFLHNDVVETHLLSKYAKDPGMQDAAVAETLRASGRTAPAKSGPRTLFATHYHEVTRLERTLPRLRNYCVSVKEWNDEIIFVRQVVEGAADRSYGIQVARLAGLPKSVIARAQVILEDLEGGPASQVGEGPPAPFSGTSTQRTAKARRQPDESGGQLQLFG
ncbi:MAG: DNA mismatch repair protein MutS [Opitutales bacterium]